MEPGWGLLNCWGYVLQVGEPVIGEVEVIRMGGKGVIFSTKLLTREGNTAIDGTAVAVISHSSNSWHECTFTGHPGRIQRAPWLHLSFHWLSCVSFEVCYAFLQTLQFACWRLILSTQKVWCTALFFLVILGIYMYSWLCLVWHSCMCDNGESHTIPDSQFLPANGTCGTTVRSFHLHTRKSFRASLNPKPRSEQGSSQ